MTTCQNCNAPMAPDQRYCLNCGARGGEARLPFLDILRADQEMEVVPYGQPLAGRAPARGPVGVAPLPVAPVTTQERLQANSGLIAGVGVLLLAMLIGVLIGSGFGNDNTQAAAAPQVISVGGGGVAPTAATGVTGVDTTASADTSSPADTSSSGSSKKSSSTSKASSAAAAPVKATNNAVKNLDKLTGKAAQKAADKLGKTIAVGGAPPKKDSKPAAAGGSFDTIG